jgi:hypothetical protein
MVHLAAGLRGQDVKVMPAAPHSRSELDLSKVDWHRIDGTGEAAIARQAAEDPDTAPVLTPEEILAAGRRVATDEVEDVRALRIGSAEVVRERIFEQAAGPRGIGKAGSTRNGSRGRPVGEGGSR